MGQYILLVVSSLSLFYGIVTFKLNDYRLAHSEKTNRSYKLMQARNCATSAAQISISKLSFDNNWNRGFERLELNGATARVTVEDHESNEKLSSMERIIKSTATIDDDIKKEVNVLCGLVPNIKDLAIYATSTVSNLEVVDQYGSEDNELVVENAPFMIEFDYDALFNLSEAQGHVIDGDFSTPKDYPNGSFYHEENIPNIVHVKGDLKVPGGRTAYGIYIVDGQVQINGSARVEGIILIPNAGNADIKGGGPKYDPYSVNCSEENGDEGNGSENDHDGDQENEHDGEHGDDGDQDNDHHGDHGDDDEDDDHQGSHENDDHDSDHENDMHNGDQDNEQDHGNGKGHDEDEKEHGNGHDEDDDNHAGDHNGDDENGNDEKGGNGFGHGGAKNKASITGGIVIDGALAGTGSHITVQHNPCYMSALAEFQIPRRLYVIKWYESPER